MATKKYAAIDYYTYKSPIIGLHACNNIHKLQDASISKTSYTAHPYQKEIATHRDENAIAKNMKHDYFLSTEKSVTKDCYSAKTINVDQRDPQRPSSMKKMAQTHRYVSTVFPDEHSKGTNCTTHQSNFTPVSLEFVKDKCSHKDMQASSNQGVRLSDPGVRSEYKYRFVIPKETPGNTRGREKDQSGVRGRAKFNLTHNTITGKEHYLTKPFR